MGGGGLFFISIFCLLSVCLSVVLLNTTFEVFLFSSAVNRSLDHSPSLAVPSYPRRPSIPM